MQSLGTDLKCLNVPCSLTGDAGDSWWYQLYMIQPNSFDWFGMILPQAGFVNLNLACDAHRQLYIETLGWPLPFSVVFSKDVASLT